MLIIYYRWHFFYTRILLYCYHILEYHVLFLYNHVFRTLLCILSLCSYAQSVYAKFNVRYPLYYRHRFMCVMKGQRRPQLKIGIELLSEILNAECTHSVTYANSIWCICFHVYKCFPVYMLPIHTHTHTRLCECIFEGLPMLHRCEHFLNFTDISALGV